MSHEQDHEGAAGKGHTNHVIVIILIMSHLISHFVLSALVAHIEMPPGKKGAEELVFTLIPAAPVARWTNAGAPFLESTSTDYPSCVQLGTAYIHENLFCATQRWL